MKPFWIVSPILAGILAISTPLPFFAHVGHGDEFQAEGGINRVQVNPETHPLLGIQVTPIAPAADGSAAVLIPVTAVVEADGTQIVFVQYKNFYEPVTVTTGATQGELIQVTEGLSVGEELVTQGSLSLYAESRKTQSVEASPNTATSPIASPQTDTTHTQADAQGLPHGHDAAGNMVAMTETTGSFPMGLLAAVGGVAVVLIGGAIAVLGNRKKKGTFSSKKGGI
jgi:cation efflux system membrane fusion protein